MHRSTIASLAMGLIFVLLSCESSTRKARIPTGVERLNEPGGAIHLIATGMASQNAIDKDSIAMMQTTSREAARLLLTAELSKPEYAKTKGSFEMQDAEFIERGLYCRLTAVYVPPAPPPPQPTSPAKAQPAK